MPASAETATAEKPNAEKPSFAGHPADHRFFSTMSILCTAVILTGFGSRYLPRFSAGGTGLPVIVHVHAAIFTTWLALFITQTMLVGRGRTRIHQKLGIAGVGLAALMLVVGIEAALVVTRAGDRGIVGMMTPDPAAFLLLNLSAIGVFAILVAAGAYFRKTPQIHKRLMLLATVSLMPPGVARLPLVSGHLPAMVLIVVAFVLAGPIYDYVTRKRLHPAYLWGGLLILVPAPPALEALAATSGWHAIAAWMM